MDFFYTWIETWSDRGGVFQQKMLTVFIKENECGLDIQNILISTIFVKNDDKNNIETLLVTNIKEEKY